MRRVRNYDAELKALDAKARVLKAKKIEQLGQLVTACGADVLDTETLAGVLIAAVEADADAREVWRAKGSAYFQQRSRETARRARSNGEGASETGPGETPR
ncbi:conjugal transfer protein TraD [Sphingomonas sp. IC081]|uniref:conjugal transfer protein TraD n=1 Tax=Sphingomonas sp. IC081 TaxID=304378 RepID=UPI00115C03DA|nr:conjugal transfer protein TraD [Sphingomonas sp. IC081]QDK36068.1 conjugal transfer protein TraC [Sphingomonas sp. IC081]